MVTWISPPLGLKVGLSMKTEKPMIKLHRNSIAVKSHLEHLMEYEECTVLQSLRNSTRQLKSVKG